MKHLMFECQQDIYKKMKEKMGEKLMADEEHQQQINYYTTTVNKLKDEILKLQLEHEDVILNQRLVNLLFLFFFFFHVGIKTYMVISVAKFTFINNWDSGF